MCVDRFAGAVPADLADLRSLPGVGDYTAAAVAVFAFGQRHAVLDTNVRRVQARWVTGAAFPPAPAPTTSERRRALDLLPLEPTLAAKASIAFMELGALRCTARQPDCRDCPLSRSCVWRSAGYPAWDGPPRRGQAWAGTDRQCRGRLMAVLRETDGPVPRSLLDQQWGDPEQRDRALASLLRDGLMVPFGEGAFRLP
jgi:A/G-specific adenine glycosylase